MRSKRVQNLMLDMRPLAFSLSLSFLFLILFLPSPIQAAPGDLDPTFGTGGKVTTTIGTDDTVEAMAIQPNGKLVAAGHTDTGGRNEIALVRYNTDGTLDTSFGPGGTGIVTTAIGSVENIAYALLIQPDGKLVVAGSSYDSSLVQRVFALVRYNTDGSLDTSFGTGGIVTTPIGVGDADAAALAIQSNGKIVAAGSTYNGTDYDFALIRYNTDGSLDTTFGTGGIVTTDIGTFNNLAFALAIQSDSKLVAAGASNNGPKDVVTLVRYNPDGSLDTTFGVGGTVTPAIGTIDDFAYDLAIQSDGKLVTAGYSYTATGYEFALARFNTDGSLDTTFGTGGIVTTPIGNDSAFAWALAIQSDGKLVAAGYTANNTGIQVEFALIRYNTDGTLDTSFNPTGSTPGIVTTPIGTSNEASALAIQSDGKLVVAGHSANGTLQSVFALARYLGGLTVTIPAGASSCVADYNGTCAFSPNPLTITSGDSVVWSNTDGITPHTATSDDHSDTLALDQPVAPANSFSTAIISGGASSPAIGPFITAVMQTKPYHCSLHPNMKGTLIIIPAPPTTTTTTVATTTTTVATTTTATGPTTTTTTTTTIPGQARTFDVNMGKTAPPCGVAGASDIGFVDCTSNTGGILANAMTTISVGDTVRWTMTSTPHTTTSGPTGGPAGACATGDNWDSGTANAFTPGFVFTHQFNTPGTCTYFCFIHPTTMFGQVVVLGPGQTTTTTTTTTSTTTTTLFGQTTTTTTATSSTTTTSLPLGTTYNVDMGKQAPPCGVAGATDIGFVDCTSGTGGILVTAMTTIFPGDAVRWTMRSTPHTTTSEAALTGGPNAACGTGDLWDSGVANAFTPGFVFTHQFNAPGNCTYYCIIHPSLMQGQVVVLGPGQTTTTTTTIPGQTTTTTGPTTTTTGPTTTTTTTLPNQGGFFDVNMGKTAPPCGGAGASDIGFVDCTSSTGGILSAAMTTISVGDTVRWTMTSTPHTVTSGPTGGPAAACGTGDLWDSGTANAFTPGFVFTHTFNTPGTCNYFCFIHPTTMFGLVTVSAGSTTTTTTIPGQTTTTTTPTTITVTTLPSTTTTTTTIPGQTTTTTLGGTTTTLATTSTTFPGQTTTTTTTIPGQTTTTTLAGTTTTLVTTSTTFPGQTTTTTTTIPGQTTTTTLAGTTTTLATTSTTFPGQTTTTSTTLPGQTTTTTRATTTTSTTLPGQTTTTTRATTTTTIATTTTSIPGQTTTTSTTIPGQTTTTIVATTTTSVTTSTSTSTTIPGQTTTTTTTTVTTTTRPTTTTIIVTTTTTVATTTTVQTTTTTTTTSTTTTTIKCKDKNKGNNKDKGNGHDKGKCKGHNTTTTTTTRPTTTTTIVTTTTTVATTTTVRTTTTTTTISTTTTTINCNDKNKGNDKDKGKGKCKGHDKAKV